jgi:hypothetical protein
MKIDKSSPDCKKFLISTLNELETVRVHECKLTTHCWQIKSANRSNDAISTDIVGQAHVESTMLKLHTWADDQDRAGVFNKYAHHSTHAHAVPTRTEMSSRHFTQPAILSMC